MTFDEYMALDETSQIIELQNAVSLIRTEFVDHIKVLFQLHSFYVEVTQHDSKIKMLPFNSIEQLEPYLQQVDISFVHQLVKLQ